MDMATTPSVDQSSVRASEANLTLRARASEHESIRIKVHRQGRRNRSAVHRSNVLEGHGLPDVCRAIVKQEPHVVMFRREVRHAPIDSEAHEVPVLVDSDNRLVRVNVDEPKGAKAPTEELEQAKH
jgi:hypothetical protein